MSTRNRQYKLTCSSCGKQQGTCFAYCVVCGTKLVPRSHDVNHSHLSKG